jgi:5-methylcytosine-specific restriction protein A
MSPRKAPTHRPSFAPKRADYDRAYNRRRGKDPRCTAAWKHARALKLARDPLCEECKLHGVTRAATQVHHVVPLEQGGALCDLGNLRSLCSACHAKENARERRGA